MHENYDLRQEQFNKSSLLSSRKFLEDLLDIFSKHVVCTFYLLPAYLTYCLYTNTTLKWEPIFLSVFTEFLNLCGWNMIKFNFFFNFQMRNTGALVISALLDFLTFALCPPYRYKICKFAHMKIYVQNSVK